MLRISGSSSTPALMHKKIESIKIKLWLVFLATRQGLCANKHVWIFNPPCLLPEFIEMLFNDCTGKKKNIISLYIICIQTLHRREISLTYLLRSLILLWSQIMKLNVTWGEMKTKLKAKSQPTPNCKMSEKRRQQCNQTKETVPVKFIMFDPPTLAWIII